MVESILALAKENPVLWLLLIVMLSVALIVKYVLGYRIISKAMTNEFEGEINFFGGKYTKKSKTEKEKNTDVPEKNDQGNIVPFVNKDSDTKQHENKGGK